MNARRLAFAVSGLFGLSLAALVVSGRLSHSPDSILAQIALAVPSARRLVETRGGGFVASRDGVRTKPAESSDRADRAAGHTLEVMAPPTAARAFRVHARGAKTSLDVSLARAAARPVAIERGVAVYRDAYPEVDALAVADPEKLEILYLARAVPAAPLAIAFDLGPQESLREEPTSHAAIVADDKGRARARVSAPRAIDARGLTREGRYSVSGRELRIALDWGGLTFPVVIDPTISLPFWSILDDPRVPGETVYDATLQSRQSHVTFDSTRGRLVLVRPVRPRLDTDTTFLFGDATNMIDFPSRAILPTPRTGGPDDPVASDAAVADWSRGYDLESETWEWDGSAWSVNASARLPGLVDPALGFDGARSRVVLYGGAPQRFYCQQNNTGFVSQDQELFCTAPLSDATVTWEYDGTTWTPSRIPGSPPPRIRASLAWMPSIGKTVLFGGRAFGPIGTAPVAPNPTPYPETLARDLLADTWTYDGSSWTPVPTGSPPDAREGAQLFYDAARAVLVLVGGHTASDVAPDIDRLGIWEFDGTDWSQKLVAGDPTLPPSMATRHGASAFYNATRQRTTILGGASDMLDFCTLTPAQIASALSAASGNAAAMTALQQTGCLGGFVHDQWEWDGHSLVKITNVVYGGVQEGTPVFEQASGGPTWQAAGPAGGADGGAPTSLVTALLPYHYDERPGHFALRTALELAHASDAGAGSPESRAVGVDGLAAGAGVSPLFMATVHPDAVFDAVRGVATLLVPGTAAVYETDGAVWTDRTPARTPFSAGVNDFLAMAWDTQNERLVAFDPRDASTWSYTDTQGWQPLAVAGGPSPWGVDPSIHSKQDLTRAPLDKTDGNESAAFTLVEQQMPKMTFDRVRGRAVMLFAGALWEFDGAAWKSAPLPPTWSPACAGATYLQFDGARGVTVVFGCRVPADTWQWNGATWAGPGPTPFTAALERNMGITVPPLQTFGNFVNPNWFGSLQLAWAHPNAAFESATLGGVTTFDADGTPRTWNGAGWVAGPSIPSGMFCLQSLWDPSIPPHGGPPGTTIDDLASFPFALDTNYWLGRILPPMCFSPPAIEDVAHGRLLAFRDGPRGMLELPLGTPPAQRAWRDVLLGNQGLAPGDPTALGTVQVNPYPFELMAPETVHLLTQSDPATRTGTFGTTFTAQTAPERIVQEMWWPYRIVTDPSTNRVRLVTDRGAVWELTGEDVQGLGDPCTADLECGAGFCGDEGVCCDLGMACTQSSSCMTCKGATPGICSPVAAGQPDPEGRCGAGPCAGQCPGGTAAAACVYDPTRVCGSPATCTAGVVQPGGHCSPLASTCVDVGAPVPACPVANGVVDLSLPCIPPQAPCAAGLACASDGATCKSGCATRTDCASRYQTCAAGTGGCGDDSVAKAAAAAGVQATTTFPPRMRSPAAIALALVDAGFLPDEAGIFVFNTTPGFPISYAFDPNLQSPEIEFRSCMDFIGSCAAVNRVVDSCVAAASRCATTTPWMGDPSGGDCCPEGCLLSYFTARQTMTEAQAVFTIATSRCYALAATAADGGSDAAPTMDGGTP